MKYKFKFGEVRPCRLQQGLTSNTKFKIQMRNSIGQGFFFDFVFFAVFVFLLFAGVELRHRAQITHHAGIDLAVLFNRALGAFEMLAFNVAMSGTN